MPKAYELRSVFVVGSLDKLRLVGGHQRLEEVATTSAMSKFFIRARFHTRLGFAVLQQIQIP